MFNKNDPLISAVQGVMQRNQAERDAAKVVNEKFGVVDRKALPHERQAAWDSEFKKVISEGSDPYAEKDSGSDVVTTAPTQKTKITPKPTTTPKKQDPYGENEGAGSVTTMKEEEELDEKAPPGAKYERMVKDIKKGYSKDGLTDKEKAIAYATAWKAKNRNSAKNQISEAPVNPSLLGQNRKGKVAKPSISMEKSPLNQRKGTNPNVARAYRATSKPLDPTRDAELDKPGLMKSGVAKGFSGPHGMNKSRQVDAATKDAAKVAVPAAVGSMAMGALSPAIRTGVNTAYKFAKDKISQYMSSRRSADDSKSAENNVKPDEKGPWSQGSQRKVPDNKVNPGSSSSSSSSSSSWNARLNAIRRQSEPKQGESIAPKIGQKPNTQAAIGPKAVNLKTVERMAAVGDETMAASADAAQSSAEARLAAKGVDRHIGTPYKSTSTTPSTTSAGVDRHIGTPYKPPASTPSTTAAPPKPKLRPSPSPATGKPDGATAKPKAQAPVQKPVTQDKSTPVQRAQFNRQIDRGNATPGTAYKGLGVTSGTTTGTTVRSSNNNSSNKPVGTGRQK